MRGLDACLFLDEDDEVKTMKAEDPNDDFPFTVKIADCLTLYLSEKARKKIVASLLNPEKRIGEAEIEEEDEPTSE